MKDDGVSNPTPKPTPTPTPGNTPSSLPRVVKLSLYNADTDQLVKGYDTLNNGDVIDVSKIGTSNLAIVATGASGTQSVKFNLNGTTYTESTGRYSIFGDNGRSNIYGKKFEADTYTLSATAYSRDGATGTAGRTQTLSFTVQGNDGETPTKPTPTQPTTPTKPGNTGGYASLKGFQLINAATGEVIKGYENITSSTTIKLSSLPTRKLALVAVASGNTQSIKLTAMGKKRIENDAPFAFLGGTDKKLNSFYAWAGNYSFSATAYSKDNAGGAKGENITLKIKFT
jgi:hypothetical protein